MMAKHKEYRAVCRFNVLLLLLFVCLFFVSYLNVRLFSSAFPSRLLHVPDS